MTKQEWVKEIIAEEVIGAINRFKEEKPYALHQIASGTADEIMSRLHSQGVVLKVDRELPRCMNLERYKALKKAGYVAVESLVEK